MAVTYVDKPEVWDIQPQAPQPNPELEAFVVSRLAELVVVLFKDHVGHDAAAMKDRAEGHAVLLALGDTATDHGRPDLMPILHGLAEKIQTTGPVERAEETLQPLRSTGTLTLHF